MKVKRQIKVKKILSFFKHNFGHHPPYQILIDGTFTQACLKNKVNIRDQLPKYLGEVKLLTTKCCIMECEKLGSEIFGATVILKQFGIHKCGHDSEPKPAYKCLKSMLGDSNNNRYFVATQDPALRDKCRKIPGTPILYLHHCAPVLEKPSEMSETQANKAVDERMIKSSEQKRIENLKRRAGLIQEENPKKKKRKTGNPNPLSCLKKKKKVENNQNISNNDAEKFSAKSQNSSEPGEKATEDKKRKRVRKRKNKAKIE